MSDQAPSLTRLLHRALQRANAIYEAKLGGITPRQLAVLQALADQPGQPQTALGIAIGADRSTVADICKRLEERGLLTRQNDKRDARAWCLWLTDEGRATLHRAKQKTQAIDEKLLARLPEQRRAQFIADLAAFAGTYVPPTPPQKQVIRRGRLPDRMAIELIAKANPKRPGTKAHQAFAKYRSGMTVRQAKQAGITPAELGWDEAHGYIALHDPQ